MDKIFTYVVACLDCIEGYLDHWVGLLEVKINDRERREARYARWISEAEAALLSDLASAADLLQVVADLKLEVRRRGGQSDLMMALDYVDTGLRDLL